MAIEFRNTNRYGPLTEERLSRLEARLKVRLPDDYRLFLLAHNGGRPTLSRFTFEVEGEKQESILEWLFAVHDQLYKGPEDWDPTSGDLPLHFGKPLESAWEALRSEKPEAVVLPIGRDPCGNLICLGYASKGAGQIWFYDHETESFTRLADSFSDFLGTLTKLPPGDWWSWLVVE